MAFRPPHLCTVNGLVPPAAEITKFKNREAGKIKGRQHTKRKMMYALKNKVQLIGNLGKAPEVITTEKGKKLARFSIATSESYRNAAGEKITETQWHNLYAWGKTAEIAEKFLSKGSEAAVEGKLVSRSYLDKEGNKKYVTEIQVNEILVFGSKAAS
jgi:single-strand DNA-binding protein